jgi:hypothetical protein
MVRHDNEFINQNVFPNFGCPQPFGPHAFPGIIQNHPAVANFPEQFIPVMGANGDEIPTGGGIIETRHPY